MRRVVFMMMLCLSAATAANAQDAPLPVGVPGMNGFDAGTMTGVLSPDLTSAGLLVTGGGTLADVDLASGFTAPDFALEFAAPPPAVVAAWENHPGAGCPTHAPPGTIRGGAIELFDLCERSVRQARHRYAADAVKYVLNQLGSPYSQARRMAEGTFDCSSLVMRGYHHAGLPVLIDGAAPTTHRLLPHSWGQQLAWSRAVPAQDARPGDLVFLEPDGRGNGHVAMVLADGWMVHTASVGDVAHIRPMYRDPYAFRYIDPNMM